MKSNLENEITFYSDCKNSNLIQIINGFLTHGLDLKPKDIRYKNRLYFLYKKEGHDKNKLVIKLGNGKLYFRQAHKNVIEDTGILQQYHEVHQNWQAFENLDPKFLEEPILSFYYKDKYESSFKYDGIKYKIVGDDTKFLDINNGLILSTLQYLEIETGNKFSQCLIDRSILYFTNTVNFLPITDAYTKQNVGLRNLNNKHTKLPFDDVCKFEALIYTVFQNIFSNKLIQEGLV